MDENFLKVIEGHVTYVTHPGLTLIISDPTTQAESNKLADTVMFNI